MEKYDIISVVGEGSYGLVMRCRHRESGQYVAIKKFLETEDDPTVRKMALREIRMLKKLRHENLVNMIEVFRRKKRFFLVFEYLEHTVLEELEARSGGLGYITSRKYIYQVLRALDFIHSHNVIHRDIKPENVLVSRLGVIKLCDFGFARPYLENETFTDYVATRWYRSPELLVGDRYGKEVDIWAVGCLYAEMMTSEPLFPGDSDIDQLFQIVRILGKLSSRHQILIMRNAMFRGMKQEQNTSLSQMFPNWNRDSIDFLCQCLKMDGMARPDTTRLLKHDLFLRDNFLDNFMTELRTKLAQEMQINPLLKRIPSYSTHSRRNSDEKKGGNNTLVNSGNNNNSTTPAAAQKKSSGEVKKDVKNINEMKSNKVNLSVLSTQIHPKSTAPLTESNMNSSAQKSKSSHVNSIIANADKMYVNDDQVHTNQSHEENELNNANQMLSNNKQRTNGNSNIDDNNHSGTSINKSIPINNIIFKDAGKYSRVLSAKLQKANAAPLSTTQNSNSQTILNNELDIQPPSPIPFQSLQPEASLTMVEHSLAQTKRLSPHLTSISNGQNIGNSNGFVLSGQTLPQYFNYRRHSNILGVSDQIILPKNTQIGRPPVTNTNQSTLHQLPFNTRTNVMTKRDRTNHLLDATLKPLNGTSLSSILPTNDAMQTTTKEPSPRILPPPQWLTGNLKLTAQGKNTQISNSQINGSNMNGKRRITDWKTVGISSNNGTTHKYNESSNNELILPNCPGATTSPKKSNNNSLKKKLSSLSNYPHEANVLITPRNFSALSDHLNET